jgi:hypothetical protein
MATFPLPRVKLNPVDRDQRVRQEARMAALNVLLGEEHAEAALPPLLKPSRRRAVASIAALLRAETVISLSCCTSSASTMRML